MYYNIITITQQFKALRGGKGKAIYMPLNKPVKIIPVFFILILLLFPIAATGQDFSVKSYTVMDGLPSSTIHGITQDNLGRLWFASRNGISVYDGYTWKTYTKKDGIGGNEYIAIANDNMGNIWGVSRANYIQLIKFSHKAFKLYRSGPIELLQRESFVNKVFTVYCDARDTVAMLAIGKEGIVVYKNSKWLALTSKEGLPSNEVRDIRLKEGLFYILTPKGIAIADKNLKLQPLSVNIPESDLAESWSIHWETKPEAGNERLWILGTSFISDIENGYYSRRIKNIELGEIARSDTPRFFPSFYGLFFYGTARNLFMYNEKDGKISYLSSQRNSVFSGLNGVIKDREENLWIISQRGVFKIRIPKFTNFNSASGLLKDEVTAITHRGNQIVLGHEEGFSVMQEGKVSTVKIPDSKKIPAENRIMRMTVDKKGNVWFAAAKKGLGYLDKSNKINFVAYPKQANDAGCVSVINGRDGNIYAASNNNVYRIEGSVPSLLNIGDAQNKNIIRCIGFTGNNNLTIGCMTGGVFIGNEISGFKQFKSKSHPGLNSIYSIYSEGGITLVGTSAGLGFVKGDSLDFYEDIKIDRPVYFVEKEKENFWFGTDFGTVKYANGKQITYTPQENLAGLETNRGAFNVDEKGNIWIGTDKGVSKYIRREQPDIIIHPKIIVTMPDEGDNFQFIREPVEKTFAQNNLSFDIKVISLVNENQNTYSAMLEGFDSDWLPEIKSSERLRYTNLPYGTYRLKVKGKTALGIWSEEFVSPEITVLAPFYLRWWFVILILAGGAGIAYFIIGSIHRKQYTLELENEVVRRTSELKDSEAKYKNLVDNIYEGVAVVQDQKVKFANPAMAAMVGYTLGEIIGTDWSRYAFSEDLAMLFEKHRLRLSGMNIDPRQELRLIHKNGNILFVVANTSLISFEDAPAVFTTIRDITEHKAREIELNKLFTAVQQSPSTVIITDPKGIVEYVNPVFEKISGFGKYEILGKTTSVIKSGMMPDATYKEMWNTLKSGNIWRGELLNKRKNGELYWVSASIAPIKNPVGEITNYIAVEDDITFEKYARQEIERKERLLNATLDKVPVIIFVLNKSGHFTFVKGNALDLLGYFNPVELVGMHISELFNPPEEIEKDLQRISKGETFTSLRLANNFMFDLHYSPATESFESSAAAIGLAINVTDYYNAENTIKEREAKIKALVNAIPDFIFEVNSSKIIETYHEPAEPTIRYPYGEIPGRSVREVFPGIGGEIEKAVDLVFSSGENRMFLFSFEFGGVRRYFESRFVLKDAEHALAIVRDVTDKVVSEQEIIKAKETAEKSDRLKSEFLAHMSHEIRTPVNTILNYTSLMEEELKEKISDELKDGFGIIRDGGFRLIRTIDLILNMSQIQTDTYSPVFKEINLNRDILSRIVQEFKYRADQKGIELIYSVDGGDTVVWGDDYTIGQIFANLIDNALKYTNKGSIEVLLKKDGERLFAEVKDTGIGISEDYLPNLFSPFTQEEMGYTRRFDGTGLGLALVKKYVEINKAEIMVESEKDKGTKFIVSFPCNNKI